MTKALSTLVSACVVVCLFTSVAGAQEGWTGFWHRAHTDFHRVNCWPKPFVYPDRMAVRDVFAVQAANGWQAQTTLGDHHFDSESQKLNHAGQLKLQWILAATPQQHRTVFVYQPYLEKDMVARMDTVRSAVQAYSPKMMAPIVPTAKEPPTRDGYYVNTIQTKWQQSIPAPILPEFQGIDTGN